MERARRALDNAVRSRPDDFEHLTAEVREAYVDGSLDPVDREVAESHLSICQPCSEDVTDLQAVRDTLTTTSAPSVTSRWSAGRVAALAGSLAAGIALAIWMGRPVEPPAGSAAAPAQASAPAPAPAPQQARLPVSDGLEPAEQAAVDRIAAGGALAIPEEILRMRGTPGVLLGRAAPADP